jgi:pimeloyl-ACP methyl ester carboxylesterase
LQAQASFEEQAEMDGFIVVYANAAPSEGRFPNSGFWQTDAGANRAIDDFAYLARVVERLGEHWRIEPGGPGLDVYLVGYGSGGQLALEAAAQHPERYVGVAAILPDKVNRSRPPLRRADTRLSRLLFVTLQEHHPGTRGAIQGEGRYWPGAPLDAARLDEWKGTIGLSEVTMRAQAKLDRPIQDQRPLRRVAVTGTALLPRRVVPAGTRMFTSSFPDQRGIAVCALVVPRKSAIDVGPDGRPAPLDVARVVRAFFFEGGVPGNPGAAGP